jgi:two-component system, chemotaxis family, chemotaxis protein CheY
VKILIIDDSLLSRNILKRYLGDQHAYLEAEDGMRGLELYFVEKPDLVFLDLTMPTMNGLDVLSQIKTMDPHSRVIVASADIQDFTRQKAESYGASAFLNKPFTADSVLETTRPFLGNIES